jgi:hypothetical protein
MQPQRAEAMGYHSMRMIDTHGSAEGAYQDWMVNDLIVPVLDDVLARHKAWEALRPWYNDACA